MNFAPILNASLAIQIHVVVAVLALVFGTLMWVRPKGTRGHKLMGRGFILFMSVAALSTLFITQINNGHYSFIHLFVPLTALGVYHCISRVRRGDIKGHIKAVKGMYFGALFIPAFLSFLPGRILYHVVFGG